MKPILLDTGVIIAWLDRSERFHSRAASMLDALAAPLVTCEAVIAEACYRLRKMPGACASVLGNIAAGTFQIPVRLSESAPEVRRILRRYRDLEGRLGRRLPDSSGE